MMKASIQIWSLRRYIDGVVDSALTFGSVHRGFGSPERFFHILDHQPSAIWDDWRIVNTTVTEWNDTGQLVNGLSDW